MALLIVYIVWGSTYLAIAVMIDTMPPLLAAGLRYVAAGVLMLAFLAAAARLSPRSGPLPWPTAANWRAAVIIGALLLLGGNGGVVLAEQYISSGMAAVLVATTPIWLAVFDAVLNRQRPSGLVVGGIAAGIVGVALLLVPMDGVEALDPLGVGLVLLAEIAWAAGSIYARRAPLPRSQPLGTGMEMLAGGVALGLGGVLLGEVARTDVRTVSVESWAALVYLIVFGSLVAFTAYTWLLANVPVSTVGTYAYVNPVVAVALGAVLLSEPITLRTVIATAIIVGAVVAMVSGRPSEEASNSPAPARAALDPDG